MKTARQSPALGALRLGAFVFSLLLAGHAPSATLIYTSKSSGGSVWKIAVPDGTYRVVLVVGDARSSSATYKFNVENTLVLNGRASSSQRWISGPNTVTVSDGRLTVSNASGFKKNALCFVEITVFP